MSRPFALPPRQPDPRRAGSSHVTENFAKQSSGNILAYIDSLARRIEALEARVSRIP